jgi:hypothetical protein
MNWGNKLVLVFLCFGASLGFLVYRCMQVPVNLVSKDYYKDELAYQQVIDGKIREASLSSRIQLTLNDGQVVIQLPPEMDSKAIKGEIWFYCPSLPNHDRKAYLKTDQGGRQVIPADFLLAGNYQVKINWQAADISYYSEVPLNIIR